MKTPRDQHFLIDAHAIGRIADLVDLNGREVLEIGPGEGALTAALLDRGATVHAVEIDHELCEELSDLFHAEISAGRLTLTRGDAVKCPLPRFSVVVSNLPYSASSKITFRLLETGFDLAILMYQTEFARRMEAPAGTSDCGRLSIMVQTYATVERCFDLPPQCFRPKPQVRSSVVKIIPREPIYPVCDRAIYADVVRTLFSHRRKTVRNCLKSGLRDLEADQIRQLILGLPDRILQARPEELSLEDFASLAGEVYGISGLSNRG